MAFWQVRNFFLKNLQLVLQILWLKKKYQSIQFGEIFLWMIATLSASQKMTPPKNFGSSETRMIKDKQREEGRTDGRMMNG